MWAIAKYTFLEFWRKKIILTILFIACVLLCGAAIAGGLSLGEQTKVIRDIAFAVIQLAGIVMTLFFGSYLLADEIKQQTLYLLLSKNSSRARIVLGKYLGFALVLVLFRVLMSIALYALLARYGIARTFLYLYALGGLLISRLVTLSIVMFFSTFVSPFVTLLTTLIITLLGYTMSFVIYYTTVLKTAVFSPFFVRSMKIVYFLIPNFVPISMADFLDVPFVQSVIASQFFLATCMHIAYSIVVLIVAIGIFQKKEL